MIEITQNYMKHQKLKTGESGKTFKQQNEISGQMTRHTR